MAFCAPSFADKASSSAGTGSTRVCSGAFPPAFHSHDVWGERLSRCQRDPLTHFDTKERINPRDSTGVEKNYESYVVCPRMDVRTAVLMILEAEVLMQLACSRRLSSALADCTRIRRAHIVQTRAAKLTPRAANRTPCMSLFQNVVGFSLLTAPTTRMTPAQCTQTLTSCFFNLTHPCSRPSGNAGERSPPKVMWIP